MAVAAIWSIIALLLIRLVRLTDPRCQALVLVAPLIAAFIGRARLVVEVEWLLVGASVAVALALLARDVLIYRRAMAAIRAGGDRDTRVESIVADLAMRFAIKPPQLLLSRTATQPFTAGFLRPVVVLPLAVVQELNDRELSTLLAHELAHISRYDFLSKWALLFLTRLSWLNPIASGLYRRIGLELECASDKLAGRVTGMPGTLARTLVKTNSLINRKNAANSEYLMVGACSSLEARIEHLSQIGEPREAGIWKTVLILALLMPICFQVAPLWMDLTS